MKRLHLPGLPKIVQEAFDQLLNRGIGLENLNKKTEKEVYGIVDDLATPVWRECSFKKDIFLSWWPVEKAAMYELRRNPEFGKDDDSLIIRDNVTEHTIKNVTSRENTFYLKAMDRSGQYCKEYAIRVLANNPPLTPPAPLVTEFFNLLKINILPPQEDDIVSFTLYLTPCDDNGTPIGETIAMPGLPDGEVLYPAESGSRFIIQVAARDLLGEGEKSDLVIAQTKQISPVHIPEEIIEPSHLSEELGATIDGYGTQIQQLEDRITLKVQRNSAGKLIITGIGIDDEEIAILANRFRLFTSATGDEEGQAVFVVDTVEKKVYLVGDLIADGTITARMLDADELKTAIASINEAFIDSAKIINLDVSKITVGSSSAPIPLAIQPGDILFRFDGSLLSTRGLSPMVTMETSEQVVASSVVHSVYGSGSTRQFDFPKGIVGMPSGPEPVPAPIPSGVFYVKFTSGTLSDQVHLIISAGLGSWSGGDYDYFTVQGSIDGLQSGDTFEVFRYVTVEVPPTPTYVQGKYGKAVIADDLQYDLDISGDYSIIMYALISGEFHHVAMRSDGVKFLDGQVYQNSMDYATISNGILTLNGTLDEVCVKPRLVSQDEAKAWASMEVLFYDPQEQIDSAGRPVHGAGWEADQNGLRSNAVTETGRRSFEITTDGNAYFGGELRAGIVVDESISNDSTIAKLYSSGRISMPNGLWNDNTYGYDILLPNVIDFDQLGVVANFFTWAGIGKLDESGQWKISPTLFPNIYTYNLNTGIYTPVPTETIESAVVLNMSPRAWWQTYGQTSGDRIRLEAAVIFHVIVNNQTRAWYSIKEIQPGGQTGVHTIDYMIAIKQYWG